MRFLAVVVALFMLGGAVQAANFHVASTATVELDDPGVDIVVPVEPILTVAPQRHAIVIEMPPVVDATGRAFAPRTFRPPRG